MPSFEEFFGLPANPNPYVWSEEAIEWEEGFRSDVLYEEEEN